MTFIFNNDLPESSFRHSLRNIKNLLVTLSYCFIKCVRVFLDVFQFILSFTLAPFSQVIRFVKKSGKPFRRSKKYLGFGLRICDLIIRFPGFRNIATYVFPMLKKKLKNKFWLANGVTCLLMEAIGNHITYAHFLDSILQTSIRLIRN